MRIVPDKMYSLLEAQKILKIKSRQYIPRYIASGQLIAVSYGGDKTGKRYLIKGEWLKDFKAKYDKGLVQRKLYTVPEMKAAIEKVLKYCQDNQISTLKELEDNLTQIQ